MKDYVDADVYISTLLPVSVYTTLILKHLICFMPLQVSDTYALMSQFGSDSPFLMETSESNMSDTHEKEFAKPSLSLSLSIILTLATDGQQRLEWTKGCFS